MFRDGSHKTISTRSLKSPLENGQAWIPITVFLQYQILLIDSCLILCLHNSNQPTLLADFAQCPLTRQNVRAIMAAFRKNVKMMFMRFLFNDFKSCYSLFKVLHIFPSRYLFAIGFPSIFSFRRCISPNLDSIPKEPDSWEVSVSWKNTMYVALTLYGTQFRGIYVFFRISYSPIVYNSKASSALDFNFELLPVPSPVLR